MNTLHQTQGAPACRPAATSPATAAAQRVGQVDEGAYDTRRARLKLLIEERTGGSQRAFAKLLLYTRSNIHHFLSTTYNHGRSMGERAARKLEHKAGLPYGWLDQAIVPDPSEDAPGPTARVRGDLDVEAERAKFVQAWCPFAPRSHFEVDAAGKFVHKAMRDRLAGWLTACDSNRLNFEAVESIFQGGRDASAAVQAQSAVTRMDAGSNGGAALGARSLQERLKHSRTLAGLTQADLSVRSGVSQSTIAQIESGRNSGTKFAHRLAKATGVSVSWLLTGEEQERASTASQPKTGVKAADVTQLQRDLVRLAAGGDSDVAAACVRVQAVIEGLLSGLVVEQLS